MDDIRMATRLGCAAYLLALAPVLMVVAPVIVLRAAAPYVSGAAVITALVISCVAAAVAFAVHAITCTVVSSGSIAGHRPLPRDFRFDTAICDEVRSWDRPQWVPRWARYTLPDPRI